MFVNVYLLWLKVCLKPSSARWRTATYSMEQTIGYFGSPLKHFFRLSPEDERFNAYKLFTILISLMSPVTATNQILCWETQPSWGCVWSGEVEFTKTARVFERLIWPPETKHASLLFCVSWHLFLTSSLLDGGLIVSFRRTALIHTWNLLVWRIVKRKPNTDHLFPWLRQRMPIMLRIGSF